MRVDLSDEHDQKALLTTPIIRASSVKPDKMCAYGTRLFNCNSFNHYVGKMIITFY